ncbi:MBL fold metallo-hydrolase [Streptomyces sp. NPDC058757]|uniref:MBL fold metallo-hydrolase n=1 Tax=Streptomyces sp. NPDC058757 TaxID=3346626 RepID=UPI003694AB3A
MIGNTTWNTTEPARRTLLRGTAAGLASGLLGPAGAAAAAAPHRTGVVARRAGRYEVLALLDARGTFPGTREDQFGGATEEAWRRADRIDPRAAGPDGTWRLSFWCYAVRRPGGRVTLVDTGVGPAGSPASRWAPVPGRLPRVLADAGVRADDVDTVVLTHLHEDHYGWAVDPDGTPLFPDARHVVQRTETASLTPADSALSYVVTPLRAAGLLDEADGPVRLAGGGLRALPTPGHTPGHQSVLVDGGRRRIYITGDVLVHAVQLADPSVAYRFERDEPTARATRTALLSRARAEHALLATAHLNEPFTRT